MLLGIAIDRSHDKVYRACVVYIVLFIFCIIQFITIADKNSLIKQYNYFDLKDKKQ